MGLSRDACYRALATRDRRFDGRFFVGVRTTGVYCRPICPARLPKLENVAFYPSAAAAQEAGLRPCLRCRPECSPELAVWAGTANTVSRALALIAEGALDETEVGALALRLGVGERQLRRLFQQHLGASPIAVAQTRRVLFAKKLLHETRMGMTDVAFAAGFGSVRRFNDTFRRLYGRAPSELRRASRPVAADAAAVRLELPFDPPYDWPAMVSFLAARAIPGIEVVEEDRYRRTIELDGVHGTVEVRRRQTALAVTIRFPRVEALPAIVARIRRVFDLGVDLRPIRALLSQDPLLAPLVAARPGLRVPGAWDGFELAVRAVLGQQVTVAAARILAGRLAERCGDSLRADACDDPRLERVFPTPEGVARKDLRALGMPAARIRTLGALARAAACDARLFHPAQDLEGAVAGLRAVPGIGEWTAQYIALRALREPDALPASDLGLLRAVAARSRASRRPTPAELLARAETWRPWRAYAAQHLWSFDGERSSPRRAAA